MPQVASDPVVQRPLRPESLSGRTGATPAESSGAFEGLLDAAPAERPARPERPSRSRGSERSRPDARAEIKTDASGTNSAREQTASDPTKPAETKITRQAKNGQTPDSAQSAELAAQPAEAAEVAEGETAPVLTVEFAAIAEATIDCADCAKAKPDESETTEGTETKQTPSAAQPDIDVQIADAPAQAPPPAIPLAAPVAAPVDAPAAPKAGASTVVAVELQVTPAPTATVQLPADAANVPAANTAAAEPTTVAGAATASADAITPEVETPEMLAPIAAKPDETPDAKLAVPADRKNEPGAPRPEHHAAPVRASDPETPAAARPDATEPKVPHRPQPQAAEHASATARATVADRPELPTTAAAPAQSNLSAPPPPFSLAAHVTLPTLSPLTVLRVDAAADNAVPVAGLALEIVARARDGNRRFEIRLDPPELGRIDVRLDIDHGGKVTSRLVVERAETLDLLRRDAPQLERALQHAGLNTEGGLEFSLRDRNFANRDQAPRETAAARLIVPDDETAAAEAARRGYGRMIGLGGGVDIRV